MSADAIEALKEAAHTIFHRQNDMWREVIDGLDADALNWRPGEETNSIAVLVAHAFDSTRFHTANSVGLSLERNREEKFLTAAGGADELRALIDEVEREVDSYIDRLSRDSLTEVYTRPAQNNTTRIHSGAWWLLHALQHASEHIGQASLTRQLYEQRR